VLRSAALLLCTISVLACNADPSDSTPNDTIVTDSAGVTWRALPAGERRLDSALTEVARIAPADSGPAAFSALFPGNVATNGVDRVFVLVSDESRIAVFDDAGTSLGSWGRRGGGPGEFGFGDDLSVGPDGTLWLFDFLQSALVRFDTSGAPLPLLRLGGDSAATPEAPTRAVPGGLAYVLRQSIGDSMRRIVRFASTRDTLTLREQVVAVKREISFPSCSALRLFGMPPYFSPELSVARTPRGVAVLHDATWRVEWYEGARLREVWTRAVPARTPDADLLRAEVDGALTLRFGPNSCTVPVEEAGEARGVAATVPALRRIAVAPDGTLWAERWEPTSGTPRVDVIAADGTLRGTIVGRGAPLGFLGNGRVVYAETDPDTELQSLVVLSVRGAAW
jgi:hypothetical protein